MNADPNASTEVRITLGQVHTAVTELKSLVETTLTEQRGQIAGLDRRQTDTDRAVGSLSDRLRGVELAQAAGGAVQAQAVAADAARTARMPAWVSVTIAVASLFLAAAVGVASLLRS